MSYFLHLMFREHSFKHSLHLMFERGHILCVSWKAKFFALHINENPHFFHLMFREWNIHCTTYLREVTFFVHPVNEILHSLQLMFSEYHIHCTSHLRNTVYGLFRPIGLLVVNKAVKFSIIMLSLSHKCHFHWMVKE